MLDAFKAGGDFHSRTAMNMYPHIREAVEQKLVLLEWHPQPGEDEPPVPLLKVKCQMLIFLLRERVFYVFLSLLMPRSEISYCCMSLSLTLIF